MRAAASNSRASQKHPLAERWGKSGKASRGRTATPETPLNIRTSGVSLDDATKEHVRKRLGRQLGKYALRIERVTVRFEDVNGPRGGIDTTCRIKIVISGRPSIVAEGSAAAARDAFDRAAGAAERAVRSAISKAGLSEPGKKRAPRRAGAAPSSKARDSRSAARTARAAEAGSHIGRRVGQSRTNLLRAAERPEKIRRDALVDTSKPGLSASDRRVGAGATATRNTRLNLAGMPYMLEDSMQDRPSRKSTRRSTNRLKADANLRRREMRRVSAPKAKATRAGARARRPRGAA